MATRTEVIRTDDLTGKSGDDVRNITFALSGAEYEIDLGAESYSALLDTFEPLIKAARPVAAVKKPKTTSAARAPRPSEANQAATIREWARENGVTVPPRGRVPQAVINQWIAATDSPESADPS